MTRPPRPEAWATALRSALGEPRLVTAVAATAVGTSIFAFLLRQTIGWPGLVAILAGLVLLCVATVVTKWSTIEWRGLLPVSLLLFVGWAGLTLLWSQYRWSTVVGLAYFGGFTVLGLYIALLRDTIQIVRIFGDVLRVALALSLVIEIIAGVLIDTPIGFLSVSGHLAELGPIQGITGARNQLGILATVGLITFITEFRTHSVTRGLSIGSLTLAGMLLLLTRSPVAIGAILVVGVAAAALYGLRRAAPERRRLWQGLLLTATVVAMGVAWLFRSPIITALNAGGELSYRLALWRRVLELVGLNPLEGWGWIGIWRTDVPPFQAVTAIGERTSTSASNAYLDVWLQLGLVGLVIFVVLLGLTFVRSWLIASRRRNTVTTWPALILVVLITVSLAESSILVEFGWLTTVICTVKAAQQLSWRTAFARTEPIEDET